MCCSRKEVGGLALPSIASLDLPSRACAPELAYTLDAMLAPTLTHATRSQPTALKSIRIAPLHMHKQMHKLVMEWEMGAVRRKTTFGDQCELYVMNSCFTLLMPAGQNAVSVVANASARPKKYTMIPQVILPLIQCSSLLY